MCILLEYILPLSFIQSMIQKGINIPLTRLTSITNLLHVHCFCCGYLILQGKHKELRLQQPRPAQQFDHRKKGPYLVCRGTMAELG